MSKIYSTSVKNYLVARGYIPLSNLLIDFQNELDISESELMFIIRILRFKNKYAIHDSELDSSVSSKTLSRRRNDLKRKGLLNFSIIKSKDPTGQFCTEGISYDLSPLEEKLQYISDSIEEEKSNNITNKLKEHKFVIEENEELEPIECFKQDFKNHFGSEYTPSEFEINEYNKLDSSTKKAIGYIFKYCNDNKLFDEITPRLSLFFKTKFRFDDLLKFCSEYISKEEDNKETIDHIYRKYYFSQNENYAFYKAIERIINRFGYSDGVDKLIEKAYTDTKIGGDGDY